MLRWNFLILLLLLLFPLGCASKPVPMRSAVYLLSTRASLSKVLRRTAKTLKKNGHKIKSIDRSLGALSTKYRPFEITLDDETGLWVQQQIGVIIERGSVKVRIKYQCAYPDPEQETEESEYLSPEMGDEFFESLDFGFCDQRDVDVTSALEEENDAIMNKLRPAIRGKKRRLKKKPIKK